MAYNGGWGTTMGAWNTPAKQQLHQQVADNEDKLPIKAAPAQLSDVDLGASPQGSHSSLLSSIRAYNTSTATAPTDLAAREAALAKREAAVQAKEKELVQREAEVIRNGGGKRRNWPICFPVTHHDIAEEIPAHMQGIVRMAYYCYLGLVVCLLFNLTGACAMVGFKAPDRMSSWFLAVIYALAGIPLAFILWYMKLYHAAASDGSLGYLGFFISFVIHTAFCIWAAIAVPIGGERWSFTGFVSALRAFDVGKAAGIIYIIGSCLWTVEALCSFWCLKMVYFNFRSSGKQQEAHNELTKMAVKAAITNKV